MPNAVASAPEWIDPRVRRTRQMLLEALRHLLETKSIDQLSVADIAEEATLNRATFYDHYPDKFTLLEDLVEAQFQELMQKHNAVFDGNCAGALMNIALATCHYLAALPHIDCPNRPQTEKYFEPAMIVVIRRMILSGLRRHPPANAIPVELTAATISAAIYGGAREWVRTPQRGSAEEAAGFILALAGPMLSVR